MREIKFRAFDTIKKQFVGNCEIIFSNYGDINIAVIPNSINYIGDQAHNGEPQRGRFIIDQFTGLKDKNGVEVYESDIIQDDEAIYKVFWSDECCAFDLLRIQDGSNMIGFGNYTRDLVADIIQDSKLIGNIHLNPDLL